MDYDTLVVSGGAVRGFVLLGALQCAQDNFFLRNIKNLYGTSVGAVICYLLAIGYTPIEMIVYIISNQAMEILKFINVMSMLNGQGGASFATIQSHLEKMTLHKVGKFLTLKDIFENYEKNLVITTFNLSQNKAEYLDHLTNPDMPCITALRMSCNLPFIFENFKYMNSLYIDGGFGNNFPMDVATGNKIIGFYLADKDEYNENSDIVEYIYRILSIPLVYATKRRAEDARNKENCKIIKLEYGNSFSFKFNASSRDKLEMFSIGYNQTKEQLE